MPDTGLITVPGLAATDAVASQAAGLVSNHTAASLTAHGVVAATASYRRTGGVIAVAAVRVDANHVGANHENTHAQVWIPAFV